MIRVCYCWNCERERIVDDARKLCGWCGKDYTRKHEEVAAEKAPPPTDSDLFGAP